jgi:transposase
MNRAHFWLTDDQFSKIEPHLPTDTRGKARVDDRRVISGIINVLRSGGRWIDAPRASGPIGDAGWTLKSRKRNLNAFKPPKLQESWSVAILFAPMQHTKLIS